ncbi:MAG: hypothetical protein ACJAZO_003776 [Myxococcota bacterium]|jgi:hypothetical protein
MQYAFLAFLLVACTDDTNPAGTGTDSDTDPDTVSDDPVEDNQQGSTGDFAGNFIRDTTYSSMRIEVDYVVGHAPSQSLLDEVTERMESLLNKPDGIEAVLDDEIPDQGSPVWTVAQTRDLEVTWRDDYRDPDTGEAVLYLVFLDGGSSADEGDSRILGYAYQGSSIVIFDESVEGAGGGGLLGSDIMPVVLLHEVGHQLGLVNLGTPMVNGHEDSEHPGHDADDQCLMYWAAETGNVTDMMLGGAPDFDDSCLNDLSARRN